MASLKFAAAVRQFSTSTMRCGSLVQAPIQVFGVEGRYAHAIYSAATKEKKLDAVEQELGKMKGFLNTDKKFAEFMKNPSLQKQQKIKVLSEIMKKQDFSNLTANLFSALAENGRLNKAGGVIDAFNHIMSAQRGEVSCSVTTAKPLDASQTRELEGALKSFLQQGQTLQLQTKVDPALIGGMVVTIADKYVDMSMASKIKKYTKLIEEAV